MKNLLFTFVLFLMSLIVIAQSPQAFKYQAIARDESGNVLSFWDIGIRISILQKGHDGPALYSETHKVKSNVYGLINLVIGEGQVERGSFTSIKWGESKHYLKIEMDSEGGSDYKELGVSQLYAVPYAIYADQAGQLIEPEAKQEEESSPQGSSRNPGSKKQAQKTTSTRESLANSRLPANSHSYLNANTGNVGIGKRAPEEKLDVTGKIASSLGYICDGEQGISDSLNIVCDIDFAASKIKYKTLAFDGGLLTYISTTSAWLDSVGSYIDTVFQCGEPVYDIDGNEYTTVAIGDQCWMQENLKVTHYPNGDAIPYVTDNIVWKNLGDNNTDDAYCYYDNDPNSEYGAIYTYAAAIADNWQRDNTSGQGICPDGWHLPTDGEWTDLANYLGGSSEAGGKMKEAGTSHWQSPNTGATNESGFTALPGGYRDSDDGAFNSADYHGYWWSATESSSNFAWYRGLFYLNAFVGRYYDNKSYGFSVRCLRDD